jgi:plastocyanin
MKTLTGSKSRIFLSIAFIMALLSISESCTKPMDNMSGSGSNTGGTVGKGDIPGTNEVWIQGMNFIPSSITVTAGTAVKWTNKDAVSHTVTSNTSLFDSGTIASNGTFSCTFLTTGTFQYYCSLHPSMTGTVVVN